LSSVPATLSWFGWLLLGVERIRERGFQGVWAFAVPVGMMQLAGHLQFAFYGLLMSLLYALYWGYETRAQGGWFLYALALSVGYTSGAMVAAVQLLPTLELSGYSHRQAVPTEAGYEAYVRNALPLFHLITAWFPNAYGVLREGGYWGAVHYAELAMSVGAFGLLLVLMGVRRRGQGAFWLGVGLLALLIALGTPLTKLLYFYLPGYSATGSPARVLGLWAFSVAILAAYGSQAVGVWKRALAVWVGGLVFVALLTGLTLPQGVSLDALREGVLRDLELYFGVGLTAGVVSVASRSRGLRSDMLPVVLAVVPLIVWANLPRSAPLAAVYPSLPELPVLQRGERIAALNTRWSLYEPPPARMPPNTPVAYRLPDVGGYDSLLTRHYKRFLDLLNGQDSAPPENGNMLFVKTLNPALARLRVRAVLTPDGWLSLPPAPPRLQPLELLPHEEAVWSRLQQNPFPDAIPVFGAQAQRALQQYGQGTLATNPTVEWQIYRANILRLRVVNPTSQTSWLLITDAWYPGWQATVNGESAPLLRANGAFRAVPVPAGEAIVEMRFLPRSVRIGALLSGLGVVQMGALALARRRGVK
ncbi:MAG: YfhO family protein, partial [bacterium]|nr:YfhO family protein [bacterium]